jgi:hypothetical protein
MENQIKVGHRYILAFEINGKEFIYHALILDMDGEKNLITFEDKFKEIVTFSLSKLISYREEFR